MAMVPSPTQSNILAAMRSFLVAVLPDGVDVVSGQPNRVAEPRGTRFVVMSPPQFVRLSTNVDDSADVKFTGSIAGSVLTVTDVAYGTILRGATVFGVGVAAGTTIREPGGTGTGGVGTYPVSVAQTLASRTLSTGAKTLTQSAEVIVQLDFHSADGTSGDMAQAVSTLLRDEYGTGQFADQSPNYGVTPLHADDPAQRPFVNENQQVEWRWVLDAHLQANQTVSVPQQYADAVAVDLISVDVEYPPA